jgi:hypothetical protein
MGEMRLSVHLECLFLVISDSSTQLFWTAVTEAARGSTSARRTAKITKDRSVAARVSENGPLSFPSLPPVHVRKPWKPKAPVAITEGGAPPFLRAGAGCGLRPSTLSWLAPFIAVPSNGLHRPRSSRQHLLAPGASLGRTADSAAGRKCGRCPACRGVGTLSGSRSRAPGCRSRSEAWRLYVPYRPLHLADPHGSAR